MTWASLLKKQDNQGNQDNQDNDSKQNESKKNQLNKRYQVIYKKYKRETANIERQKLESDLYDVINNIKNISSQNLNYLLDNVDSYRFMMLIKDYYSIPSILENYYVKTYKKKKSKDKNTLTKFVNIKSYNENKNENENESDVEILENIEMGLDDNEDDMEEDSNNIISEDNIDDDYIELSNL
jgi:hypothetical protein